MNEGMNNLKSINVAMNVDTKPRNKINKMIVFKIRQLFIFSKRAEKVVTSERDTFQRELDAKREPILEKVLTKLYFILLHNSTSLKLL